MRKDKAIIYIKIENMDKENISIKQKEAENFCKEKDIEVADIILELENKDSSEDVIALCDDKDIDYLVVNNLYALSNNIYDIYDKYKCLLDYYNTGLISIEDGDNFKFKIEIVKGDESNEK